MEGMDNISVKDSANIKMMTTPSLIKYLPYIILYPFQGNALFFTLIVSAGFWVGLNSFMLMGLPLLIILLPSTFQYAYTLLQHTALGGAKAPMFKASMLDAINLRVVNQLMHTALLLTIAGWLNDFHPIFTFIILAIIIFFTPLNVAIIALQNNLFKALNPFFLIRFLTIMGKEYILLLTIFVISLILFFLFLTMIPPLMGLSIFIDFPFEIQAYIANHGGLLYGFIFLCIASLLMSFHATGFMLYHRRDQLDLTVFISPEQEANKAQLAIEHEINEALHTIHHYAHATWYDLATTELFTTLKLLGDNVDNNAIIFERMRLWEGHTIPNVHAQHYLNLLIQKDKITLALEVYQKHVAHHANFKLDLPNAIFPLANMAFKQHQYQLTFDLIKDFTEYYPAHADKLAIQVLQVKSLTELKNTQEAKKMIKPLLQSIPTEHKLFNEVKYYAQLLAKLD